MSSIVGYFLAGEKISFYEILSIIGGFMGVMLMVNDSIFAPDYSKVDKRHAKDLQEFHYYYLGLLVACLFTIFSALNFHKMREMGANVHSSIKTFYFGALHSLLTMIWIAFMGPSMFCFWEVGKSTYTLTWP